MASLTALVFQHFPDSQAETRYRLEQRQRQARFTRPMAIIAAGMFYAWSKLRVGINTGPVVGGVISGKRMHNDYRGDAINVAQRMETAAAHNGVAVSQSTWEATREIFAYAPPRVVLLKNLGEVPVYDLGLEHAPAPSGVRPLASTPARR